MIVHIIHKIQGKGILPAQLLMALFQNLLPKDNDYYNEAQGAQNVT